MPNTVMPIATADRSPITARILVRMRKRERRDMIWHSWLAGAVGAVPTGKVSDFRMAGGSEARQQAERRRRCPYGLDLRHCRPAAPTDPMRRTQRAPVPENGQLVSGRPCRPRNERQNNDLQDAGDFLPTDLWFTHQGIKFT